MSSPAVCSLGFRRARRALAILSSVFACTIPSGCGAGGANFAPPPPVPVSVQPPVTSNPRFTLISNMTPRPFLPSTT